MYTVYLTDQVLRTGQVRCVRGCWWPPIYFRVPALNPETPSYDSSDRYDYIPKEHVFGTPVSATIKARQMIQEQITLLQKEQQKLEGYLENLQVSDGVLETLVDPEVLIQCQSLLQTLGPDYMCPYCGNVTIQCSE